MYEEVAHEEKLIKRRQVYLHPAGALKDSLFATTEDTELVETSFIHNGDKKGDGGDSNLVEIDEKMQAESLKVLGTAMPIFKTILAERSKTFGYAWISAPVKMSIESQLYVHMHSIPHSPDPNPSPDNFKDENDICVGEYFENELDIDESVAVERNSSATAFGETKVGLNSVALSLQEQADGWVDANALYTPINFAQSSFQPEPQPIMKGFNPTTARMLPRIVPEEDVVNNETAVLDSTERTHEEGKHESEIDNIRNDASNVTNDPTDPDVSCEGEDNILKPADTISNRKALKLTQGRSRSSTCPSESSNRKRLRKRKSSRSKSLPPENDGKEADVSKIPIDKAGEAGDPITAEKIHPSIEDEDPVTFYLRRHRSSSHSIHASAFATPSSTRPGSASVALSKSSSYSSLSRATDTGPSRRRTGGDDRQNLSSKGLSGREIMGPNLYEIVHSSVRRLNTLSPGERGRYPTLTDPGIPEELAAEGEAALEPIVEIEKLSQLINSSNLPIPAFLRRRGILSGRLSRYEEALVDLSKAIQLHNVDAALKDLDAITDSNKLHLGAFQAKARIYQEVIKEERQPGLPLDPNVAAIVNYSQVIRLKPEDPDGYYQRACLFELENEMVYANEDFKMVRLLDPSNEHAIHNLAVYSFQRQLWDDAIQAFTKLLRLNALNGQAFLYRGRAYAYLAKWDEALRDLTMAIQLAPDRADVFYHRGCLLRERNRRRAIEDLSISVLLDDGPSNSEAFFQRAVLYYKLKKYDLSIIDYTTVVELEPSKSVAWLNLGIIFMRYFNEFYKALECFNKAIQYDPIQIRAYLCRGDLFQILHSDSFGEMGDNASFSEKKAKKPRVLACMSYIDRAIRDYSKAIHMCPSDHLLYLYRGKLLLKQGRMKESTYDFHSAFELNSSIAQTFVQVKKLKYKQIIFEFNQRSKLETIEDPALFMLIAKARVKCNDNEGAIRDLSKALEYNKKEPQIYLQRGICYENLRDWSHAAAEFSRCIAQNPGYAKAYYHRGLCKLHEGNSRGVVDLDRALKYDPKFFEAYLTRASYYHARGAYTEGIEDCNEALKLEPTSIRAHLLRGACKCKLHQYGLAIVDFTKAIQLDKSCHFAFYNRAVTYQLLEDLDNAIKDYSIVLLIHNDSNAYRNRGLIYWKQGDAENALLDLYAARDNFPGDARLHGLLALCLQKVGRISESLDAFSSAINVNPYLIEAYLGRGNVYASINNSKSARRDYARVIHLYPKCTEAYVNMGYTMQMENRFKKSWELFTMAIAINPQCTPALEGRAVVHCTMRNYFGALVDISKAIACSPDNAEYLVNQGVIYQALDDSMSALQSYKAAIKADSKYSLAFFNAANLYFSQRRWEMALQYYNEALLLDSKDISAILNRGITKAMLEDMEGALEDFNQSYRLIL
ncbi:cytochrome c oxidase subunit 1 [Dinochytrium kinnereticum]|nr:cytochrome c oxidase subunit 1 [Dinochytrium kinnereticum]